MSAGKLTAERVRELLDYCPLTGLLTRRVTRSNACAGDVAGTLDSHGYSQIGIDGRKYSAHRLAWLIVHGSWPTGQVDHVDGDPANNRLNNLRNVSQSENQHNQIGLNSRYCRGVSWYSRVRKFQAQIMQEGNLHYLGLFKTESAAAYVYLEAKRRLHPTCPPSTFALLEARARAVEAAELATGTAIQNAKEGTLIELA